MKKNKNSFKAQHSAHLKQGINFLIAVKSQIKEHTGGQGNFYRRLKDAVFYQIEPLTTVHNNMFHLSQIKDHAQY